MSVFRRLGDIFLVALMVDFVKDIAHEAMVTVIAHIFIDHAADAIASVMAMIVMKP